MTDATKPDVTNMLSDEQLKKLHDAGYETKNMTAAMSAALPALYPDSASYVQSVLKTFYGDLPSDGSDPGRGKLSLLDRERCLIAILASQNDGAALAIHMYCALMEGLTSAEIAHILLLSGVYTGMSHFSRGLIVEQVLLGLLAQIADSADPKTPPAVIGAIIKKFEPAMVSGKSDCKKTG